ncbi:hypothetical protein EDC04DRAFT_2816313 [Pisolithus marmoratus]|nr:hypothetical protein EDC04DRAFT_2816313 [Pisolithus marmoratus]
MFTTRLISGQLQPPLFIGIFLELLSAPLWAGNSTLYQSFILFVFLSLFFAYTLPSSPHVLPVNDAAAPAVLGSVLEVRLGHYR